jgi:hypothetical protein
VRISWSSWYGHLEGLQGAPVPLISPEKGTFGTKSGTRNISFSLPYNEIPPVSIASKQSQDTDGAH